jgi:hypothetical protein
MGEFPGKWSWKGRSHAGPRKSRRVSGTPRPQFVQKLIAVGSHQRLTKVLGSPTLLKAMAEEMHLRGIVDNLIPWHGPKGLLTHGEVVEALVLNRLRSPRPLHRFERWAEIRGIGDLYEHPGEDFHDDRVRQTLDAIAAYDADIQAEAALRTLTHFGVPKDMVLYDLTSQALLCQYDGARYSAPPQYADKALT